MNHKLKRREWMDKRELAKALGVSPRTIDGWWERYGQRNTDPFMHENSIRVRQGARNLVFYTPDHARAIARRWWKKLTLPRRCRG